jgi:hypothetical protein
MLQSNTHLLLQLFLLLFFLGAFGSLDLLLNLAPAFLEGSEELGKDAWALGAILFLGSLLQDVET